MDDVGLTSLELLTVPEVAALTRLSEATIWRMLRRAEIGSVKVGAARRISRAQLAAWELSLAPGPALERDALDRMSA